MYVPKIIRFLVCFDIHFVRFPLVFAGYVTGSSLEQESDSYETTCLGSRASLCFSIVCQKPKCGVIDSGERYLSVETHSCVVGV